MLISILNSKHTCSFIPINSNCMMNYKKQYQSNETFAWKKNLKYQCGMVMSKILCLIVPSTLLLCILIFCGFWRLCSTKQFLWLFDCLNGFEPQCSAFAMSRHLKLAQGKLLQSFRHAFLNNVDSQGGKKGFKPVWEYFW